jgi:copper chaperone CopZ
MAFLASVGAALVLAGAAHAETKVELKGVHLCCGACVNAVANTVKQVDGVKAKCDRKERTVMLIAVDDAAAQKALDALAAAGFHGESDNDKLKMKDDSGATAGKTKSVTVSGVHNCCGQCCRIIKQTVKKVPGVTGETAMPKEPSFTVTGDFDAADLVKALNAAGFHAKVEQK